MFLRRTERKKNGKTHHYWNVVENKRLGQAGGAAARFVSRRDQLLAGGRMAQGDRGFRRGCRPFPDAGAVPGGSLRNGRGRCVGCSASPFRDAAASPAAMGRLLADRAVVAGASARSVLGRSVAAEPKEDTVGSDSCSAS